MTKLKISLDSHIITPDIQRYFEINRYGEIIIKNNIAEVVLEIEGDISITQEEMNIYRNIVLAHITEISSIHANKIRSNALYLPNYTIESLRTDIQNLIPNIKDDFIDDLYSHRADRLDIPIQSDIYDILAVMRLLWSMRNIEYTVRGSTDILDTRASIKAMIRRDERYIMNLLSLIEKHEYVNTLIQNEIRLYDRTNRLSKIIKHLGYASSLYILKHEGGEMLFNYQRIFNLIEKSAQGDESLPMNLNIDAESSISDISNILLQILEYTRYVRFNRLNQDSLKKLRQFLTQLDSHLKSMIVEKS